MGIIQTVKDKISNFTANIDGKKIARAGIIAAFAIPLALIGAGVGQHFAGMAASSMFGNTAFCRQNLVRFHNNPFARVLGGTLGAATVGSVGLKVGKNVADKTID